MLERRHSDIDRRSGKDRRRVYDFDYFFNGGVERRDWIERRSKVERRVGRWSFRFTGKPLLPKPKVMKRVSNLYSWQITSSLGT